MNSTPIQTTRSATPVDPQEICAVVVTYQPDSPSFECLRTLITAAPHTVIVDNHSSPGILAELRNLTTNRVTLVENIENTGIAAALNQGIAAAVEKGYAWFLLFDQDTLITPGYFSEMAGIMNDALAEFGDRFAFLGSNFFPRMGNGFVSPGTMAYVPGKRWQQRNLVITSGTLIALDRFRAIGPFREDFFIGYVDTEYCLRAQQKGLVVASTVMPLIVQRIGMRVYRRAWLGLGRKRPVEMYSPLRRYYDTRNLHCLQREFAGAFSGLLRDLAAKHQQMNRVALLREGRAAANLLALWLAWRHGRSGRTGKYRGGFLSPGGPR